MKNYFISLSELKLKAKKEVQSYTKNINRSTKLINSIMGSTSINKNWLKNAKMELKKSNNLKGNKKRISLINALFEFYKYEFTTKSNNSFNNSTQEFKREIESSYLNEIIKFIEKSINNKDNINENINALKKAIAVLKERNSKLALSYNEIILNSESLQNTFKKLEEFFLLLPNEINCKTIINIKSVMQLHKNTLRKDSSNYEITLNKLKDKMEEIYQYYYEKINIEYQYDNPSLYNLLEIYKKFIDIYSPLKPYISSKNFNDFFDCKQNIEKIIAFLDNTYPDLYKMYNYLAFPKKFIDTDKITELLLKIKDFEPIIKNKYKEISKLNPNIKEIKYRLEQNLADFFKSDIIELHKFYNEILNNKDLQKQIDDMIIFITHLNQNLNETINSEYIISKIKSMKSEIYLHLLKNLEHISNKKIKISKSKEEIKDIFDYVFNMLIKINDLKLIESIQKQKKMYLENPTDSFKIQLTEEKEEKEKHNIIKENKTELLENINHFPTLTITDNSNLNTIVIFSKPEITFGRNKENDIIVPNKCISSLHCSINFNELTIKDNNSTNGTKIDNNKINTFPLVQTKKFLIASSFEFSIKTFRVSYLIELDTIIENKCTKDCDNYIKPILNTQFIRLNNSDFIDINPFTGRVSTENNNEEYIRIENIKNSFLFSNKNNFRKTLDKFDNHDRFTIQIN